MRRRIRPSNEFCSTKARLKVLGKKGWSKKIIKYFIANTTSGVSERRTKQILRQCFKQWSRPSKLNFTLTNRKTTADILISFVVIDGPGNTLGRAKYPEYGGDIEMDNREKWADNRYARNKEFDLYSVFLHEIGHAIGVEHSKRRGDVMYAKYVRPAIRKLTGNDISAAKKIYARSK